MEEKRTTADLVADLHAQVEAMVEGEDWRAYLEQAARFHDYSFGNQLLIAFQRPDATRVAGFHTWKSLGRHVCKGEHGIRILAPITYTKKDENGEKTDETAVGFRSVVVFDVSQTDGKPLAEIDGPERLTGDGPAGLFDALADQVKAAGFTLSFGPTGMDGANGVTRWDSSQVILAEGLDPAQQAKTLAHELAHVLMHRPNRWGECRGVKEVEAESVAYVVCRASGLESDGYSFPYVAGWSGGDVKKVRATGQAVSRTAKAILDTVAKETTR